MLAIALSVVFFAYLISITFTTRVPNGILYVRKSRLPFGLYKNMQCLTPGLHFKIPLYHSLLTNGKTRTPISIPECIKEGEIIAGRKIGSGGSNNKESNIYSNVTYAISLSNKKSFDSYLKKNAIEEDLFVQLDKELLEVVEKHFSNQTTEKSPNKWLNGHLSRWFQKEIGLNVHIHALTVYKISTIYEL
jgi:hypothetical protein